MSFLNLKKFITEDMSMQHIYQKMVAMWHKL